MEETSWLKCLPLFCLWYDLLHDVFCTLDRALSIVGYFLLRVSDDEVNESWENIDL